ncbi:MAG: molybdopterin-dependent oxidoreductase [Pseudomonadota bacterium]
MTTRTTCPYCGVGCGILAANQDDGSVAISGDPDHPANFGRLCSKGAALGETTDLEGRLLAPLIDRRTASWDQAISAVADGFGEAIDRYGPDSVAFYVSGQLLTEDYYVANKLMKGYIGTANIDTNSRLCMASSVAGHKRAFGTDTVPGTYEDLDEADLVVLVGSNLAWCHPVLHQRLLAARAARGTRIVNIDPRRTATGETADLHLALAPGSDTALFGGLLSRIRARGAEDRSWIAAHVKGADAAFDAACGLDEAARITGIDPSDLASFYDLWIDTPRVVTVYSQGVNQARDGTDKVNAILNCHLATGRIGTAGCGPFSVTGQPNAMGGREVGGLANMLASHLSLEVAAHREMVQDFWRAPRMAERPGLKAVELFDACADGRIKALWIMCTNPAVSLPNADHVADAIRACPFVVVSDIMAKTDTTVLADILLPATGWGEKDGTVTNSERRISRQRRFLPVPGEARDDWRIICDVARGMGFDGFDYTSPAEVFDEYAHLSTAARDLGVDLDLSGLVGLSADAYAALAPVQWPVRPGQTGDRFFGDGQFFTADGRARMLPISLTESENQTSAAHPYVLNSGRVRDHWHTMTRTSKSPTLSQHIAEPYVEIHPQDAAAQAIEDADLVTVQSPRGHLIARARICDRTAPGQVFVPMHWTACWTAKGRVNAAVAPVIDPVSGQPELKRSPVRISPFQPAWYGFAISRAEPQPDCAYWAKARVPGGWRVELAGTGPMDDWESYAQNTLNLEGRAITAIDTARGTARLVFSDDKGLEGAFFVAPEPVVAARSFLAAALATGATPAGIIAGVPSLNQPDPGPTVCACFNVGLNTIRAAVSDRRALSVEAIGALLHAGTNCGSCRPELQAIVDAATLPLAAE